MGRSPASSEKGLGLKKGPWTPEEDELLTQYINIHGPTNWRAIPIHAGLQRCGKSCRLRWTNYLRTDIKRGKFSFEEEEAIIQLHSILGNKWSAIASRLPGRTDNEIKNYWNTHLKKRLLKMGIDPVTHRPRLDLLNLSSSVVSSAQQNLSNLLGLQALVNPDMLRTIVSTLLLTSHHLQFQINPNLMMISQYLKLGENQSVDDTHQLMQNNDECQLAPMTTPFSAETTHDDGDGNDNDIPFDINMNQLLRQNNWNIGTSWNDLEETSLTGPSFEQSLRNVYVKEKEHIHMNIAVEGSRNRGQHDFSTFDSGKSTTTTPPMNSVLSTLIEDERGEFGGVWYY